MASDPGMSARPARFPSEYGTPEDPAERMPWEFVEQQLEAARNYWIAALRPSGMPHVRPVDGVWVDGRSASVAPRRRVGRGT